jgi:putative membrane-bound dehydrogenase-like protein
MSQSLPSLELRAGSIVLALSLLACSEALGQREFGFVNTQASGQPYLTPEESLKRMQVPEGYEIKVFAAEPDIINPIAFTVDERGRLWVVECYEYPKRTPPGRKARDRIKILEDTTGAGKADKVTIWAEGKDLPHFDMASGIEVGHGGVFLGAAPYLMFLEDTRGQGHCDRHRILLSGFGSADTHEVLNTFQWGPDSRLYGLEGIFTQSKVNGIEMNASVWRYDVAARKFEVFAEGTSNPWGMDFDRHGQAFLTCCVIPHAFHMIPGGRYIRQAGASTNPHAYGLLTEISDHLHHQESGWAHAGALVMEGEHVPPEFQHSLLMGSIHGCSVKRDILDRRGSTFVAHHGPDFLVSGDKNFRPVNLRWGPDGSIYLIDWHDQNPCHQASPDSWDMTHGRIYKIQRKGAASGRSPDLGKKSSSELVELLKNSNPWYYRTALRVLGERQDPSAKAHLLKLAHQEKDDGLSLRGVWGLNAIGALNESEALRLLEHKSPWVRQWTIRLLGEREQVSGPVCARFTELAEHDPAPEVRLQLAATAQRLQKQNMVPLLHALMCHVEDSADPCLPLMIWLAYEPRLVANQASCLDWLKYHAEGNALISSAIVPRAMRRLVATGQSGDLAAALKFVAAVRDNKTRSEALNGLQEELRHHPMESPPCWKQIKTALAGARDGSVRRLARRVAALFQDPEALRSTIELARNPHETVGERLDAVRDLAEVHPPEAVSALENLVHSDADVNLRAEACRGLAAFDSPSIAPAVLAGWRSYPQPLQVEAVNLLAGRAGWAKALLAAVGSKVVPASALSDNTILRMRAHHNRELDEKIAQVWGRVHSTPAELNALIVRMRKALSNGTASIERGRKVFELQCAKCHRFEGHGHDVGPNLDGAARDIEYLLVNVLDPNRVIGQPYFARLVALRSGRIETGLLAAEDAESITLRCENDVLKTFQRKEIEEIVVQEKSLMPEGLQNNMTEQDFRDLIRYVMADPFLTDVAIAGPFPVAMPVEPDLARPFSSPALHWSRPAVGPVGQIPLPAVQANMGRAICYVAEDVAAPRKLHTQMRLGAAIPLEAWVNAKLAYKGKPSKGLSAPDQVTFDVELEEGVNHLLFRLSYGGSKDSLFARLVDPQRKLRLLGAKLP